MSISEQNQAWVSRTTGTLSFCALIFLILACAVPTMVTTSLTGEANVFGKKYTLDVHSAQGLFRSGVCWGDDVNEDLLKKFGVDCNGKHQTSGCDKDHLTHGAKQHCKDFQYMQGWEITSIIFTVFAIVISTRSFSHLSDNSACQALDRFGGVVMITIALIGASAVIKRLHNSDVVNFDEKDERWECSKAFGAELCHGFGPSYYFQALAVALLAFSLLGSIVIAFAGSNNTGGGGRGGREPLMGHDGA